MRRHESTEDMTDTSRLHYLDNLKVLLIFLVIVHHAGQAYGSTGGVWLYSYPGDRVQSLGLLFRFDASFFMGLFFFISGYFFPPSFDRHGARTFVQDKLIRFGIPLIAAAMFIIPVLEYVKYVRYTDSLSYHEFYIRHWLGYAPGTTTAHGAFNIGHLWFIEHLLIYALLYAGIRVVREKAVPSSSISTARSVPLAAIIFYIAILGFVTHLMRTSWGFPINRWIFFLGFIQMEPAHVPQYLSLFVLGILAYRFSFLGCITTPHHMLWLIPGLGIYLVTIFQFYGSGRQAADFLWEYREALLCVGLCIGLLAMFRTYCNRTNRMMQMLAENAYCAYIIHVPVVVALQYAFDAVHASALTLFLVVSFLSIIGSFSLSFLIRLIPGVKRIL